MEALQKQINLLKTYISTLEKQNDARNQEKNTLFNEIDRLTAENDRLNALLLSKSTVKPSSSLNSDKQELAKMRILSNSLTVEVTELKKQNANYKLEIDNLKAQKKSSEVIITSNSEAENLKITVTRLTANVREKETEILRLTQQKQNLLKDLQLAQQSYSRSSTTSSQILSLKSQVANYRNRITQLQIAEQNFKSISSRLTQLESQNRRLGDDFRKKEADCRQFENQVKKLQTENRELRANARSPTQLSNLLSSKLSLQATIRQLNSKLEWSETNIKSLQGEKSVAQRRVKELEKQLLEVKGKLTQYKFSEESYKNVQANVMIRQKQMQALQQMIVSLKQNKKYLEKTLKEKEEIVVSLESQIYTLRSSNYEVQRQRNELNELRLIRSDFERQIANLSHSNQEFESENNRLKLQIKSLSMGLNEAREERQRIIRRINIQSEVQPEVKVKYITREYTSPSNNQQDLRKLVQRLQMEVQEMKNSTSSKIYHHFEHQDSIFSNQRSSMMIREKSPVKVSHSKLINQKDKQIVHRGKWQNLQRKINALRSENQILKRSLFE